MYGRPCSAGTRTSTTRLERVKSNQELTLTVMSCLRGRGIEQPVFFRKKQRQIDEQCVPDRKTSSSLTFYFPKTIFYKNSIFKKSIYFK